MPRKNERRLWAWDISAYVYAWAYNQVAHQTDVDMLTYLSDRVVGATVADCGCGPGVVSEKLLQAGVARVVAIDSNPTMLENARARLSSACDRGQVIIHCTSHEGGTLPQLCQQELDGRGFDIILFKRSLYMPRSRALATLRQAASALQKHGVIVVVHPERLLRRYAFASPYGITRYTLFHLVNRLLSRLAEYGGAEEYTLYTRQELLDLLREAVPDAVVEAIPSQQHPYNLAALHVP